jgi:hypothetical protein
MLLRVMDSLAKLGAVAVMIAVALSRSAALSLNIGNPFEMVTNITWNTREIGVSDYSLVLISSV